MVLSSSSLSFTSGTSTIWAFIVISADLSRFILSSTSPANLLPSIFALSIGFVVCTDTFTGLILYFIILSISLSPIFVIVIKFPCKNESLESSSLKYSVSLIPSGSWSIKQKIHLFLQVLTESIIGFSNSKPKASSISLSISYIICSPDCFSISSSIYSSASRNWYSIISSIFCAFIATRISPTSISSSSAIESGSIFVILFSNFIFFSSTFIHSNIQLHTNIPH